MKFCLSLYFILITGLIATAQQVQISLGPDEIGENQGWTITVTVQNDRLKSYDNFPDIEGFRKRGTSTQSTTSMVNGQVTSSQSVIMNYTPMKQGIFNVPSFTMTVNNRTVNVPGKKVKVGPAAQQQRDPFKNFFDRSPADDFFGRDETEFVDVKDDAFLALTTSKDEVYVGEGFNTTLAFYVSEGNRAPLQFYELSRQLSDILKKIKPVNSWEENFNIENIEGERVNINGQDYTQYKIYQATFYPLNAEDIVFPAVGLEMIKYKVAKNPSFFGQNRQENFKTFHTRSKRVKVKELPPHPLKDVVAVGDYRLDERIGMRELKTGQSTAYEFNIYGEGNVSAIDEPKITNDGNFEVYEPNTRQDIGHSNNRVTGTKSFNYFLIPKEPGQYNLGKYFQFVFFNPNKQRYDTLRSKLTLAVAGESKKNEVIQANDMGNFYNKMNQADNTLHEVENQQWQKWAFNGLIVSMLAASAFLLFKK